MKKGFTLVELLAIVILLAGLFMLTYPKLTEMFQKESEKIDQDKIDIIYNAVDRYIDNDNYSQKVGTEYCFKIEDLYNDGFVAFNDDAYIKKSVRVKIGKTSNYHEIIEKCLTNNQANP